jgi:hypothetical protein
MGRCPHSRVGTLLMRLSGCRPNTVRCYPLLKPWWCSCACSIIGARWQRRGGWRGHKWRRSAAVRGRGNGTRRVAAPPRPHGTARRTFALSLARRCAREREQSAFQPKRHHCENEKSLQLLPHIYILHITELCMQLPLLSCAPHTRTRAPHTKSLRIVSLSHTTGTTLQGHQASRLARWRT